MHTLWLVKSESVSQLETYSPSSPQVLFYKSFNNVSSGNVTWNAELPPGSYVLQYRWGTYRNCAPLFLYGSLKKLNF